MRPLRLQIDKCRKVDNSGRCNREPMCYVCVRAVRIFEREEEESQRRDQLAFGSSDDLKVDDILFANVRKEAV